MYINKVQRIEGRRTYLEDEKQELSEALDKQRHTYESKVSYTLLTRNLLYTRAVQHFY